MRKHGNSSAGNHNFSSVETANIPRSTFNRSSGLKTTFDASYLIPIFADEALPGDTFNMSMTTFVRQATPLHPLLDNMYIDSFWFAVPIRLIWENWEKFNGAQDNPGDSTTFLIPQMVSPATVGHSVGSLSDYLGIPPGVPDLTHSSLWHRAYNLIFNEWFRPEDIMSSSTVDTDDGPDAVSSYNLLRRSKRHDYFTSCLPWPQKGTAVSLPLGTSADIKTAAVPTVSAPSIYSTDDSKWHNLDGGDPTGLKTADAGSTLKLYADLSEATAATINQLREAMRIQEMYERDARGGTRYTEILRSHFNVVSADQRLQRPEFLGGGHQNINTTPVPQTAEGSNDVGHLGAYATSTGTHGFVKSFTEHCVILGLISARADITYQAGLHRMFSRRTRFDFMWPSFAHLGEQAVLTKELYVTGSLASTDDDVFGYVPRYDEYRYAPSRISGKFRSQDPTSIDTWHLAQDFGIPGTDAAPTLNGTFLREDVPMARVNAVPSEPDFLGDFFFDLKCARPMPTFSIPGLGGRF